MSTDAGTLLIFCSVYPPDSPAVGQQMHDAAAELAQHARLVVRPQADRLAEPRHECLRAAGRCRAVGQGLALEQGQAKPDPADPKGPLTLAVAATKDKTRIVLFGTANLAVNQFLNVQGNPDFFMNTISWLAEQEDQISIRPRDTKSTPVFLTSQQAQAVFWLPVVILPALAVAGGIVAVVRRRAAK